jgi:FtsP/CotA-like multicopper oxidase with cupredoxin domain
MEHKVLQIVRQQGNIHSIRAVAVIALAALFALAITEVPPRLLPNPPELRAKDQTLSLTLHAAITNEGKDSFYFNGQSNAPALRLSPGDELKITYINDLPTKPKELCLIPPRMDMTNLHFHGLTVSPDAPQDDVVVQALGGGWDSSVLPARPECCGKLVSESRRCNVSLSRTMRRARGRRT